MSACHKGTLEGSQVESHKQRESHSNSLKSSLVSSLHCVNGLFNGLKQA